MNPTIREVGTVLGWLGGNAQVTWILAGEMLYRQQHLPVILPWEVNVASIPSLFGDPEIIPIEGEGNIFDRVRGLYEIAYCYVLPYYHDYDYTKEEIAIANSLSIPVRYLKASELYYAHSFVISNSHRKIGDFFR